MPGDASLSQSLPAVTNERAPAAPALAWRYAGFAALALASTPYLGRFAAIALWLAASNLAIAAAYAAGRVGVFGKRREGGLALGNTLLLLPYLLLVWAFFWLKTLGLRREPCFHAIGSGLYLGRRPRAHELPKDCALVVDLTCEFAEPRSVVRAARYRCLPILNRHVPGAADFDALLHELLACEGGLYLHCGAGRGRSAMLAAALLVLRGEAASVAEAEQRLKAIRPGVHLHAAQRALVERSCEAVALRRAAARQSRPPSVTTLCA